MAGLLPEINRLHWSDPDRIENLAIAGERRVLAQ